MLPLIGLIIGLVIGLVLNVQIPEAWSVYVAVVILCGVDSLLGGWRQLCVSVLATPCLLQVSY